MRIICVDDDPTVLEHTVSMCRALPQTPEAEGFLRPEEALAYFRETPADIALLEIDLPGMNGIALAARIRELRPETAVVFLTAHPEYALEAFGVHASGYLLKPVSEERLSAELGYAFTGRERLQTAKRVKVRTFGEFDVMVDDEPVVFHRARAKELLAFLVDRQGGFVTRANVFAALWEDALYNRPMQKQLDVVIRSMRKTLEQYGIGDLVEVSRGSLRVVPEKTDCDLYRFCSGDARAADAYRGEYMNAYSWASLTESYLDSLSRRKNSR